MKGKRNFFKWKVESKGYNIEGKMLIWSSETREKERKRGKVKL